MKEAVLLTDGYKSDHRRQYPEGTEYVYSDWTPRSCHYYPKASEGAVVFGIQYFIKEYLMKQFQQNFFDKPKDVAVAEFKRYGGDPEKEVICTKVRDPKTGQLSGFRIENPEVIDKESAKPFVVIDDLCDGGGTFKGVAQLLGFHYPDRERHIYVTHMVNPKGITTLSENYKKVYFTNSYKDWDNEVLPNNVEVIKVV